MAEEIYNLCLPEHSTTAFSKQIEGKKRNREEEKGDEGQRKENMEEMKYRIPETGSVDRGLAIGV